MIHCARLVSDPIVKDQARMGSTSGLSTGSTPVSTSSMITGQSCDFLLESCLNWELQTIIKITKFLVIKRHWSAGLQANKLLSCVCVWCQLILDRVCLLLNADCVCFPAGGVTSMSSSQPMANIAGSPVISSPSALATQVAAAAGAQPWTLSHLPLPWATFLCWV